MRKNMFVFALPLLMLMPIGLWAGCANTSNSTQTLGQDTVKSKTDCGASIVYTVEGDMIHIEAQFVNTAKQAQAIRYKLRTEKAGQSGTSSNSQGGAEVVSAGATVTLSKVSLDYAAKNTYAITLSILDKEGQTICEVSKYIGQ